MAFEEYRNIVHRISLREFDKNDMVQYAWRRYWAMIGILTESENPDVISEAIYKPANDDLIIDYIIDKISPQPFILIRVKDRDDKRSLAASNVIYDEMLEKMPIYSLPEIIKKSEVNIPEGEIHALGKGYDPDLKTEIQTTLSTLATSTETTPEQKKAAIIAIGYISDPKNFNPILEQFTQDSNSEVAELAQSMLQAGHAILNR